MRALFLSLLLAAGMSLDPAVHADEKTNAGPEKATFRVLGLFSPDRNKDLREAFATMSNVKLVDVDFDAAQITVEFIPGKAFPGSPAKDYHAVLDGQLRQASNHTFGVRPKSSVPREKLKAVEIAVAGLDCKACALGAYEVVARIDGVEQATASFKDRKVTARIDPAKTNQAALEAALRHAEVKLTGR